MKNFGGKTLNSSMQNSLKKDQPSFKEAWRKCIEKFSPRKTVRLNEVSFRFQ